MTYKKIVIRKPMFFKITATFSDGRVQDNIVCEQPTSADALAYARAHLTAKNTPPLNVAALRIDRDKAAEIVDSGGIDCRL